MVKRGIELEPLDTRWGIERTKLWKKEFGREHVEKIKRAQLDQLISYVMSGLHHSVEFDKRQDALEPIYDDYRDAVSRELFTVEGSIKRLKKERQKALDIKQKFDRIEKLTSDEYSIQDWIEGKI